MLSVPIRRFDHASDLPLPTRATEFSAGVDLLAAIGEPIELAPLQRALVPTGVAIALPPGHEAQVRPRSGFAAKHGITVLNSPGTIDADYRGEVCVILINLGSQTFRLERGMRIAQMVVAPVTSIQWDERSSLSPSERNDGGFGSTGTHTDTIVGGGGS